VEPSLDLQKAIRARLIATAPVVALVPAAHIRETSGTPSVFPSILIGEGQTIIGGSIARNRHTVFSDLHVWQTEPGLAQAKGMVGTIRQAFAAPFYTLDHHYVADLFIASTRFMRDPDGLHSHGVVSIEAQLVGPLS